MESEDNMPHNKEEKKREIEFDCILLNDFDYYKCAEEIAMYYEDRVNAYQSEIVKILAKHFPNR